MLEVIVVHFAGVEQCGSCVGGAEGMGVAVGVVGEVGGYSAEGMSEVQNICLFTCYGAKYRDNSAEMFSE